MNHLINIAQCNLCKDFIISRHTHHYAECKCGAIFVDGGQDYERLGGDLENFRFFKDKDELLEATKEMGDKLTVNGQARKQ